MYKTQFIGLLTAALHTENSKYLEKDGILSSTLRQSHAA